MPRRPAVELSRWYKHSMTVSGWLRSVVVSGVVLGAVGVAAPASAQTAEPFHSAKPETKLSKYLGGADLAVTAGTVFHAYMSPGETLDLAFSRAVRHKGETDATVTVTAPDGTRPKPCTISASAERGDTCGYHGLTSDTAGAWTIEYTADGKEPAAAANWTMTVKHGGRAVPGRVWTDVYRVRQGRDDSTDISLYFLSEFGYQYQAIWRGYNAGKSTFQANAAGLTHKGGCTPINHNASMNGEFSADLTRCGPYKVFFGARPDPTLPDHATTASGDTWLLRDPVEPKLGKATFAPSTTRPSGGIFKVPVTDHHGVVSLRIDVNNNGKFTDKVDRTLEQGVSASGTKTIEFTWDGRDAKKHAVDRGKDVKVRATVSRLAPIYFVGTDVEGRSGGLEVIHLTGDHVDERTLYWNDTSADDGSISPHTVQEGVVHGTSLGGARSWKYGKLSWGDNRRIVEWTHDKVAIDGEVATLTLPQRLPRQGKSSEESQSLFALPDDETGWLVLSGVGTAVVGLGVLLVVARLDRRRDQLT